MTYTVRLCRDLTGWFASMSDDVPGYPGATVQWESAFECHERAMSVLDLAQDLAMRLVGDAFLSWGPQPEPRWSAPVKGSPGVDARRWVSHHYEAGIFLVLAQVSHDQNGHGVRLTDSRGYSEAVVYYPSRPAAFAVADKLVGIRYRAHVCNRACSSWAEEACVARRTDPLETNQP
jgi:hypothetical protein